MKLKLGVLDQSPIRKGGTASDAVHETIDAVGKVVADALAQLGNLDPDTLRRQRQDKFLAMGKKGL